MGRRKEFKSIATSLTDSFISRNNDVGGYWGIGKLYSEILKIENMSIQIDLINKSISSENDEFIPLIDTYSEKLFRQLRVRRINIDFLKSALITLNGLPNEPTLSLGQIAPNRIHCKCIITDDLGKKYQHARNVWCRPHDPQRELKRVV